MRTFEDFVKSGDIRKKEPDFNLANALKKSAEKNLIFVRKLEISDENAEQIINNCYDIMRELIEVNLASEGYKSYSHEAVIIYLKKFNNFNENEIDFLDDLRKTRNRIKYYGKESNKEEAQIVLNFMDKTLPKIKLLSDKQ